MSTTMTDEEHAQVTAAIEAAESRTSGEIFAVVARESDDYIFIALFWIALLTLILGPVVAVVLDIAGLAIPAVALTAAELAIFALLALLAGTSRFIRMKFVPGLVKHRRAHRHAVDQFLAHNLHTTDDRTGVLLFVSLAERHAEVIPDTGLADKIDAGVWHEAVEPLRYATVHGGLGDGFVSAIDYVGDILSEIAPPGLTQKNALPNHVVEL